MKKHTRLLKILSVALAMLMLLAACGNTGGTETAAPGGTKTDAPGGAETAAPGGSDDTPDGIGFVEGETLLLVIPGSAGGGSDLCIRVLGQTIQELYGITTTFENYNNTVGHQTVKDAKPDGLTLTMATGALNVQYITGQSTVDPMNDFTLIAALIDNGFNCIAVPANAPYDTFEEFIDYAKAHPGELNVGMPASGSNTMFYGMLQSKLGIELNPVECANEADRLTNLAGGFIDIGSCGIGNALQYEEAGMLKVLATYASNGIKIEQYPEELPDNYKTLQQQGYDNLYYNVYNYVLGPKGMDPTMVKEMNASFKVVLDACADQISAIGPVPGWMNLEDSAAMQQQEFNDLVEIAKSMGVYVQG